MTQGVFDPKTKVTRFVPVNEERSHQFVVKLLGVVPGSLAIRSNFPQYQRALEYARSRSKQRERRPAAKYIAKATKPVAKAATKRVAVVTEQGENKNPNSSPVAKSKISAKKSKTDNRDSKSKADKVGQAMLTSFFRPRK